MTFQFTATQLIVNGEVFDGTYTLQDIADIIKAKLNVK